MGFHCSAQVVHHSMLAHHFLTSSTVGGQSPVAYIASCFFKEHVQRVIIFHRIQFSHTYRLPLLPSQKTTSPSIFMNKTRHLAKHTTQAAHAEHRGWTKMSKPKHFRSSKKFVRIMFALFLPNTERNTCLLAAHLRV